MTDMFMGVIFGFLLGIAFSVFMTNIVISRVKASLREVLTKTEKELLEEPDSADWWKK